MNNKNFLSPDLRQYPRNLHRQIFETLHAPDQRHNSRLALQFSAAVDSKISIVRNDCTPACTNLQIPTALTVASNPPNRTPRNERPSLCI
jgi:hypothetical protein